MNQNFNLLDSYLSGVLPVPSLGVGSGITFPVLSKSADSCCAGFLKNNTGLQIESSLQIDNGSINISSIDAYIQFFNGIDQAHAFGVILQGGPRPLPVLASS